MDHATRTRRNNSDQVASTHRNTIEHRDGENTSHTSTPRKRNNTNTPRRRRTTGHLG